MYNYICFFFFRATIMVNKDVYIMILRLLLRLRSNMAAQTGNTYISETKI